jgi:hypothetical protein
MYNNSSNNANYPVIRNVNLIGNASTATNVAWSGITSMPSALGSATQPVYWNGSGFTLANSYPTVNNGTLSLQANGTTVISFTAN